MRAKLHSRIFIATLCAAALALSAAPLARLDASTLQGEPQPGPTAPKLQPNPSKVKILEFKGIVMSFSTASITVRNQLNQRQVQSFSYTPKLHDKVVALMQKGGYQNGDKVTVKYAADTAVAQEISGKPSKPKTF
jgi:hypothetical protein